MVQLVVETAFETPLTDEEHDAAAKRLDPCLERYGARWRSSFLARDRMRMICLFEAPDAESVRSAWRSAGMAFERVWPAEVYQSTTA